MPVSGSTSTSAVVRVQTLGSAQPWGMDTAPGAISSLVRAVPTSSPWALCTRTALAVGDAVVGVDQHLGAHVA